MPKRHASDRRLSSLRVTAKEIGRGEVHALRSPLPPPWTVDEAQRAFAASASSFSDSVSGTRPLLSLMFSRWCAFPSPGIT